MSAVGLRWRAEFRRRWAAWVALGLLLGLAVGAVSAVAVAARRADSVATRFQRANRGFDAYFSNFPDPFTATYDPALVEDLPMVASSARVRLDYLGPRGNTVLYTAPDGRFGNVIERPKVLAGRLPDPRRAEEVAIGTGMQQALGAGLGDQFSLLDPSALDPEVRPLLHSPKVRIVGVVAVPNFVVPPRGNAPGGVVFGTPALHEEAVAISRAESARHPENGPSGSDGVMVRLRRGAADLPAFQAALERLPHKGVVQIEQAPAHGANLRRSVHLQAVTLWLLALLLAVVGIVAIIATIRQSANVDAVEVSTLRALGMTGSEFNALAALRGLIISAVGVVFAVVIAITIAPRLQFGLARAVEPNEGLTVDSSVLVLAVVAVVALGVVTVVISSVLARRGSAPLRALRVPYPAATSVPVGVGVRFACTGLSLLGRGIVGPAIGVAALSGALVFGASLAHLREAPVLYGWPWQVVATNYGDPGDSTDPGSDSGIAAMRAVGGTDGVAIGGGLETEVQGTRLAVLMLDAVQGDPAGVLPPIVAGRAPLDGHEIALAARSMKKLHVGIGDRIEMSTENAAGPVTATVVGQVVLPPVLNTVQPGDGALMPLRSTFAAFGIKTGGDIVAADSVYARLAPGKSVSSALADMNTKLGGERPELYEVPRAEPQDLVDFGRVDRFPLLLGGVLALLAAATLVQVLVSSVRRRRHDLATLRALGLSRSELAGVVGVQSAFLALLAIVIGVPLGILGGRLAWTVYADRSGFIAAVQIPVLALLVVCVLTLLVAEACAAIPARIASRTRPAQLLRSE